MRATLAPVETGPGDVQLLIGFIFLDTSFTLATSNILTVLLDAMQFLALQVQARLNVRSQVQD